MKNSKFWVSGRTEDGGIFADEVRATTSDEAVKKFESWMAKSHPNAVFTSFKYVEM